MLLFLACLGERDAWVSRAKLPDLLWFDSEGDKAQRCKWIVRFVC